MMLIVAACVGMGMIFLLACSVLACNVPAASLAEKS